jgi:hypothetical protein
MVPHRSENGRAAAIMRDLALRNLELFRRDTYDVTNAHFAFVLRSILHLTPDTEKRQWPRAGRRRGSRVENNQDAELEIGADGAGICEQLPRPSYRLARDGEDAGCLMAGHLE